MGLKGQDTAELFFDKFEVPAENAGLSGIAVASAGDINGDGLDDLMIGAANASHDDTANRGETYILYGKSDPGAAVIDLADLVDDDGFVLRGANAADLSGFTVASAGDFNRDGYDDMLIGARKGPPLVIGIGKGAATVWTCDLTHRYIEINADYRS